MRHKQPSYLIEILLSGSLFLLFSSFALAQSKANPELKLSDRFAEAGKTVQFVVTPTDQDGVVPGVSMKSGPDGAQLADNHDGTRTFKWTADKPGEHTVTFTVVDGQDYQLSHEVDMQITVRIDQIVDQIRGLTAPKQISSEDGRFLIGNNANDVQKILVNLPVSESQLSAQQTPIDVADGRVYISNIEIGPLGDGEDLPQKTVLRQGVQKPDGGWHWEAAVIEDRTVFDPWHTAPAVGVDKDGYVHVAYNMHYMPWQYKRSVNPHQIDQFEFLGQAISEEKYNKIIYENNIEFPTLGFAAIPGNQITYPAFHKDRNDDLFISYRFAATPKRRFSERTVSTGIAAYDTTSRNWRSIGGDFALNDADFALHSEAASNSTGFAGQLGWTSYHPRLLFDNNNQLYINWFWRLGRGGPRLSRPCLLVSPDRQNEFYTIAGEPVRAPVSPDTCGNLGFSNDAEFLTFGSASIDANGVPHLLLSPINEARQIVHYDASSNAWIREAAPNGATEIFFDKFNTLWAISSGLQIFKRESGSQDWTKVYDEGAKNNCSPSAKIDESGMNAFIHTHACDGKSISVYALRLNQ